VSGPVTSVARVEDVQIFLKNPVLCGPPSNFQVMYRMYYKNYTKFWRLVTPLTAISPCAAREPSCNSRCDLLPQKVGVHTVTQPVSQLYSACWQNGQYCVWGYLVSARIHRTVCWTEHAAAALGLFPPSGKKYQERPIDMNLKWLVSITGPYIPIAKAQKPEIFRDSFHFFRVNAGMVSYDV